MSTGNQKSSTSTTDRVPIRHASRLARLDFPAPPRPSIATSRVLFRGGFAVILPASVSKSIGGFNMHPACHTRKGRTPLGIRRLATHYLATSLPILFIIPLGPAVLRSSDERHWDHSTGDSKLSEPSTDSWFLNSPTISASIVPQRPERDRQLPISASSVTAAYPGKESTFAMLY